MRQASKLQTVLPALQGIRILLHGLPSFSSIPLLIPPTRWATRKDTFSIQHPGINIRFDHGMLYNSTPSGRDAACMPGWGYMPSWVQEYVDVDSIHFTKPESSDSGSDISTDCLSEVGDDDDESESAESISAIVALDSYDDVCLHEDSDLDSHVSMDSDANMDSDASSDYDWEGSFD